MKETKVTNQTSDERMAYRGILICTICEILAILFFYAINVWFFLSEACFGFLLQAPSCCV